MDRVSPETRSRIMRSIRSRDTMPERVFAEHIGIPYSRRNRQHCNADFTFPRSMVAVFIDGEFWHGKGLALEGPGGLPERWRRKLERNVERDRQSDSALRSRGWLVLRFWAGEVLADPGRACLEVRQAVRLREGMGKARELPW